MVRTWRGKQRKTIYFGFFKWLHVKEGLVQPSLILLGFKMPMLLKYIIVFSENCWQQQREPDEHHAGHLAAIPCQSHREGHQAVSGIILANLLSTTQQRPNTIFPEHFSCSFEEIQHNCSSNKWDNRQCTGKKPSFTFIGPWGMHCSYKRQVWQHRFSHYSCSEFFFLTGIF